MTCQVLSSVGYGNANDMTTKGETKRMALGFLGFFVYTPFSPNFSQFTPISGAGKKKCLKVCVERERESDIYIYIYIYITNIYIYIYSGNYMSTLYIKFKLGITHFAHDYGNLPCSLQTKAFKTLVRSGIWTHGIWTHDLTDDLTSLALPSELSGHVDMISSIIYLLQKNPSYSSKVDWSFSVIARRHSKK